MLPIITDLLSVAIIGGAGIVLIELLVPGERARPQPSETTAWGDVPRNPFNRGE